jgi:hypothetical protein
VKTAGRVGVAGMNVTLNELQAVGVVTPNNRVTSTCQFQLHKRQVQIRSAPIPGQRVLVSTDTPNPQFV